MGKLTTIILNSIKNNVFVIIFAVFFIYFILFAASYSILSSDDFYSAYITNKNTLLQTLTEVYFNWSFRLNAIIVNYLFCNTINEKYHLFYFQITTFLVVFISFIFVLKNINSFQTKFKILLYAILSTSIIYFSSHNLKEAVFWMASVTSYLYAVPIFLVGISFVNNNEVSILKITSAFIVFFIASGFSEVYGATFLILIAVLLIRKILLKQNFILLIVALIACLTSFYINYSAPGNNARASLLPYPSIFSSLIIGTKTIVKIFTINLRFHQIIALLLCVIIIKKININNKLVFKSNKIIIFFTLCLAILPIYLCSYILSDAPPDRILILSQLSFIFLIAFYLSQFNFKSNYLIIVSSILLIVFIAINYKNTVNYYTCNTQQLIILEKLKLKNNFKIYLWNNNTNSGLIYPTIINSDSNYFTNQHIKKFMRLNFNIVSKK